MRPSPLPAQTAQTPALPGFRVSGDAKNAGFESFATSPGYHPIRADVGISDPSALMVTKEPVSPTTRAITPFERVQMIASLERRVGAALVHSLLQQSPKRQLESSVFDSPLLRQIQVVISSRPFATSKSFRRINSGLFERILRAEPADSSVLRPSTQPRPKAGATSHPSLEQVFERVQMIQRPSLLIEDRNIQASPAPSESHVSYPAHGPIERAQMAPTASPFLRSHADPRPFERAQPPLIADPFLRIRPDHAPLERVQMTSASGECPGSHWDRSVFERAQAPRLTSQFLWPHLKGARYERLQRPPAASDSLRSPLNDAPFERVQIRRAAAGHFSIPSRPPYPEPRPSAPRATHARGNPTPKEETRMPPPQ